MRCSAHCVLGQFFGPNLKPQEQRGLYAFIGFAVFPYIFALYPVKIYFVFLWNESVFNSMHMHALQCTALQTVC